MLQKAQLDPCLAAVEKRISARVEHLEALLAAQIALLVWREFLSGWLPPAYSAAHCNELQARSAQLEQQAGVFAGAATVTGAGGGDDSGGSTYSAGATVSSNDGGFGSSCGGSGTSNGSGGTPAGNHSSKVCEFRKHIPPSIDIVGDKLGVACPSCATSASPAVGTTTRASVPSVG